MLGGGLIIDIRAEKYRFELEEVASERLLHQSRAYTLRMKLILASAVALAAAEQSMNRCVDSDTWHKRGDPAKDCKAAVSPLS